MKILDLILIILLLISLFVGKFTCTSLVKHYAMKTWGSEGIAPPLLTSTLNGDEWSVSIGLEAGWTPELAWTQGRRAKSCLHREWASNCLACSPSLYLLSYSSFSLSDNAHLNEV
jgi:hypothetical protein